MSDMTMTLLSGPKISVVSPENRQVFRNVTMTSPPPEIQCGVAKVVVEPIIVSVVHWVPCNESIQITELLSEWQKGLKVIGWGG